MTVTDHTPRPVLVMVASFTESAGIIITSLTLILMRLLSGHCCHQQWALLPWIRRSNHAVSSAGSQWCFMSWKPCHG